MLCGRQLSVVHTKIATSDSTELLLCAQQCSSQCGMLTAMVSAWKYPHKEKRWVTKIKVRFYTKCVKINYILKN